MNFHPILARFKGALRDGSPQILSATAVVGVVTTAYLASKASIQADKIIERDFGDPENGWEPRNRRDVLRRKLELTWRLYIPAGISGATTIACIVGSDRVSSRRIGAAQSTLFLTEQAYSEYRNKVTERHGADEDVSIRDEIAEEKVKKNPPSEAIVIAGAGNVLCCELFSGRYFMSDMETLRRCQNDLNERLLAHDMCSLDDFYDMIGLQPTQFSGEIGWHADKLMTMEFTTVLTEDNRPCLAFEYGYTRPLYG